MNGVLTQQQPWYKEPWPWILMAGPGIVVIAGFITLWLALSSADGVVADAYYKQGLAVNDVIHRDQAAQSMGLQAEIMQNGQELRVFVTASENAAPLAEQLNLHLAHPTRSGMDQNIVLTKTEDGFYSGRLDAEIADRWHVYLEDQELTWRLSGDWRLAAGVPLQLLPQH
ncbi:MAG: FixH family protein [Zoogloeaceae bacterium]|jgi:hypothetical protein|nr:FixH family protein [Zoogloeaceae bacterium]